MSQYYPNINTFITYPNVVLTGVRTMAERINLGGEYETDDGETKTKYWVDVSSSLMNRINPISIQENETPGDVLADVISGERELDEPDETDENDE